MSRYSTFFRALLVLGVTLGPSTAVSAQTVAAEKPPVAQDTALSKSAVGVPHWKRDLVIDGSEVEVRPSNIATAVILRIDTVRPHGTSFRYDIEYYGLEAGTFDLREFLRRKDGSSLESLAPIHVVIESSLAAGTLRPNAIEAGKVPRVGGYTTLLWIGGVLWVVGLVAILAVGRRRKRDHDAHSSRPQTVAERLRPLIEQGLAGTLSRHDSAELELTLIAYWRRKLQVRDMETKEALEFLKTHDQAGPLLRQLELWLHSPAHAGDVDVQVLLAPYQNLAADALDFTSAAHAPRNSA